MARPVDEHTQELINATRERRKAIGQARQQKAQESKQTTEPETTEQQTEDE